MDITFVPSQTGYYLFPIVLSVYLLLRMEKRLENLTRSINSLIEVVSRATKS